MDLENILSISGIILGTLGGGALIVFACSSWLGKVWANRLMEAEKANYAKDLESLKSQLVKDTENYKVKLKKSEFIFQKEFEATTEFISIKRSFLPSYNWPDMDWFDVCDSIARDFKDIEIKLEAFLSKHGAILPKESKQLINSAEAIAGEEKFNVGLDVPTSANQSADDLFKKLCEVEEILLKKIHSQSSL